MRSKTLASLGVITIVAVSLVWHGCGGDDGGSAATFRGNVSTVTPTQAAIDRPDRRWLARASSLLLPEAIAQSTCPAKAVLVCANNGQTFFCLPVRSSDCDFVVAINARDDFANGSVFFVNDANKNGEKDTGEQTAGLLNPLGRVCNGTVVHLTNVAINFTAGTAAASTVEKDPDTCTNTTPTRTPTGPTRTPTTGGPTPTRTPTYSMGASLNQPPSAMLAFLSGAGVIGLLLPTRRRSRRK
jgi:hypothetical protein